MIRTSFLIPQAYNDGNLVEPETIKRINRTILENFGGYSIEGKVQGAWISHEGVTYIDTSWKYAVAVDGGKIEKLREILGGFRELLKQEAIYLEVGHEVEFI